MFRPRASGIRAVVVQIYRLYRSVPSLSTREKKNSIYPDFFLKRAKTVRTCRI